MYVLVCQLMVAVALPMHCAAGGSLRPDKLAVAVRSAGVDATADALGTDLADALW